MPKFLTYELVSKCFDKKCYKSDFYHSVIDEESNKICFLSDYRVKQSLLDKTVPFFTNISGAIVFPIVVKCYGCCDMN